MGKKETNNSENNSKSLFSLVNNYQQQINKKNVETLIEYVTISSGRS